ncbi:cell division protein FtsX [Sulfurimonas sp. HSL-1716]|uniref:cell division protein FtsX n=1 Tax=Hydrocurvibacter sulfurireducens TaxID=3131937 RepID=UPI0031F82EFF
MKSLKNHFSLILALFSILFAIQVFTINSRALKAYEEKLSSNYSMIVVANSAITDEVFKKYSPNIDNIEELSADEIIEKLQENISKKNIELLKISMPKFYRIHLKTFPSPSEIKNLTSSLMKNDTVTKVEDFSNNHDTVYKLLLLFKEITQLFALVIIVVTVLLIAKEMRIWQFKHSERMNIMGLFGAPVWLRSAVLFRLAIVDAILSSILAIALFSVIAKTSWAKEQLHVIGIDIDIFKFVSDGSVLGLVSVSISILLAGMIVIGYKEEV